MLRRAQIISTRLEGFLFIHCISNGVSTLIPKFDIFHPCINKKSTAVWFGLLLRAGTFIQTIASVRRTQTWLKREDRVAIDLHWDIFICLYYYHLVLLSSCCRRNLTVAKVVNSQNITPNESILHQFCLYVFRQSHSTWELLGIKVMYLHSGNVHHAHFYLKVFGMNPFREMQIKISNKIKGLLILI
jgi:hypothetical protein